MKKKVVRKRVVKKGFVNKRTVQKRIVNKRLVNKRIVTKLLVILSVLSLFGCSSQARLVKQQWHEVKSDHFRILTDGNKEDVGVLIRDLERFRMATAWLLNYSLPDNDSLTIFALKDRASYEGLTGPELARTTSGLFYDSLYGRYALVNLNGYQQFRLPENNWARQFLFHEYTHYLMARGASFTYPYWYREGFAEFLSTAECDGEGKCFYGNVPIDRAYTLTVNRVIDVEDLLRATSANTPERKVPNIYASGWLLTHMWSTDREGVQLLPKYLDKVRGGSDPVEAYEKIFQASIRDLDDQYKAYSRNNFSALHGLSLTYPEGFGDIKLHVREVDAVDAVAELGKVLAIKGKEDSLQELRQYAEIANIDTEMLEYSIAFVQIKRAELSARQQLESSFRQESRLDVDVEVFGDNFKESSISDYWPRLVYAENLRWEVQKNPALREEYLTRAYNLYKNIVKENDAVAAAWYGLGVTASQLMVPASTYNKYLWKAYSLSPQSEEAALAYFYSLYEAEMWSMLVDHGQHILPIISDQEGRRRIELMVKAIQKQLPNAAGADRAVGDA